MHDPPVSRTPLVPEIMCAHEEVEEMLQAYAMEYNTLWGKLEYLWTQISTAEDLVSVGRKETSILYSGRCDG